MVLVQLERLLKTFITKGRPEKLKSYIIVPPGGR